MRNKRYRIQFVVMVVLAWAVGYGLSEWMQR